MHRRYALMEKAGVQHVKDLTAPLAPMLIVCDEFFELVAKNPGSDEQTKAENELRAQCANSARSLAALGRAAGIHEVLLAQRADAEIVKGSLQNNLLFRALLRPLSAGVTARNMIGLQEVEVSGNPRGRAVMKSALWPECEVQTFYLDAAELDRYLPKIVSDSKPTDGQAEAISEAESWRDAEQIVTQDRDDGPTNSDASPRPESSTKPGPDRDRDQDDSEHGAGPDPSIDPLDFWDED